MKAIILAAGKGTRIKEMIGDLPKCLVDINGIPLIKNTIQILFKHRIYDVTVVVGYEQQQIVNALKEFKTIKFVYNKEYDKTNGIYSIWLATQKINFDSDTLLMSGDLYVTDRILDILLLSKKDPVLLTDSSRIKEADFKFGFENSVLIKYGKELTIDETNGECLGIAKMSEPFAKIYVERLNGMISKGITNLWWESVFYDMIHEIDIYVEDVAGSFWGEVDTYSDYLRIIEYIKNETH